MTTIIQQINSLLKKPYFPYIILGVTVAILYYKLILFGQIPFPGDLLVSSYSPWFDYYKLPVQNPLISDVFSTLILWKYLSTDILKSGQWPLWNPYSFSGTPLLATFQSATLYPLNILLLLPKYFGWGIFIFSQTLIAAIGMYLLLSTWLSSKLARMSGAVIFALGGLMTTWLETGIAVHAIIWLPFSLFFTDRYFHTLRIRYLLLLIISLVFSILAGHVQMVTFSFIILLIFSFLNCWGKNINLFYIYCLPIILSLFLSLTVCSIQILPSLDLLGKSIRLNETYTTDFNHGLLPFRELLRFFIADFFGNPVTQNYWGFLNYFETSNFMGSLTLPLLIFSFLFLKRGKITIFFLLIFILSLLLSFSNPLSQSIYQMRFPLLTSSYASRMLFITLFSVAALSAFSINQILTVQNKKQEQNFFISTTWGWASLTGILIGAILSYQIAKTPPLLVTVRNSVIPVLISSIFLALFIFTKNIKPGIISAKKNLLFISLFILITVDLGRYFLKFNPFVGQNLIFPNTPVIQFLQKQPGQFRIGREHAEVLPPNTWTAYNLQSIEGYDPLYLNKYARFINFLNGTDLRSSSSSRYAEITRDYSSVFIDAANVKFFIGILRDKNHQIPGIYINPQFNKAGYKKVFQDKSAVILENPNALDRVYFVSAFKEASDLQIENILMADTKFNPGKEALLSKSLQISSITGKGEATITDYSPNTVKIKTKTQKDELLILADQYEEGWRVKIDGTETKLSPANLIFRAVKIPSGQHEIIFYYWPKSFEAGLILTFITFLLITLISIYAIKKHTF